MRPIKLNAEGNHQASYREAYPYVMHNLLDSIVQSYFGDTNTKGFLIHYSCSLRPKGEFWAFPSYIYK